MQSRRIAFQVVTAVLAMLPALFAAYVMKATDYYDLLLMSFLLGLAIASGLLIFLLAHLSPKEERAQTAAIGCLLVFVAYCAGVAYLPNPLMDSAKRTACLSNLKQLSIAVLIYAAENDERLPISTNWRETIRDKREVADGIPLKCPSAAAQWTYGMNAALSCVIDGSIDSPDETVLLFEASGDNPNINGGKEMVEFRHDGGANFAFADSHVKAIRKGEERTIIWKPYFSAARILRRLREKR